jgi:hypothetical protein
MPDSPLRSIPRLQHLPPLSDAEKAAQAAVDPLIQWGQKVDGQQ